MKVIVAGSRTLQNYTLVRDKLGYYIPLGSVGVEIVSGGAKGADELGERFAAEYGYKVKRFPADWHTHGKAAGPIRNEEMAQYATHCVVFWDGKSPGSKSMIELARKCNLKLRVVKI